MYRIAILILLVLSSCTKTTKKIPIEGQRSPVWLSEKKIKPSFQVDHIDVSLPYSVENKNWSQVGGSPDLIVSSFNLGVDLKQIWNRNIGRGSTNYRKLLTGPIVFDNIIYVIDTYLQVSALNASTGELIWKKSLKPKNKNQAIGGGLAYYNNNIFVTSPFAEIISLDAKTGELIWRKKVNSPIRASPVIKDNRIFALSIDNKLIVLDTKTGRQIWSHTSIIEGVGLLGSTSPTLKEEVVIVPYSSGEVFALRIENGHPLWFENVASLTNSNSIASLAHIKSRPVIDNGVVFLVNHEGNTVALDLRTGAKIWSRKISSINAPIVSGNFLFLLTNNNQIVCFTRQEGYVKWVKDLPSYNEDRPSEKIIWNGPVLSYDRLIFSGSNGECIILSTINGEFLEKYKLPGKTLLPPIIADKKLFFLTEDANLVAFQ